MSYEKDYMYAIDRSGEYLEHYGIKGMKWGVRKALESGNSKALARQYRKASRKLARLEKHAANREKYKKRAIASGIGAAAAGGLAVAGTSGVAAGIRGFSSAGQTIGQGITNIGASIGDYWKAHPKNNVAKYVAGKTSAAGTSIRKIAESMGGASAVVTDWGKSSGKVTSGIKDALNTANKKLTEAAVRNAGSDVATKAGERALNRSASISKITNDTVARAGAAAVGAGLAGYAGYNAYRAATSNRAAKKAKEWRSEMNKAFSGTRYATSTSKKRRKHK